MGDSKGVILEFGSKVKRAFREDGWFNMVSGLGTSRDKQTASEFEANGRLDDQTLENLYADDDMAARIADALPEEIFRRGYDVQVASQADQDRRDAALGGDIQEPTDAQTIERVSAADAAAMSTDLKAHADRLELQSKFVEAMVWGRVYGLGAIILGADDGAKGEGLAKPLNTEAIRTFDHMNVLDKRFMQPNTWYTDPTAPKFGKPETYYVTPQATSNANTAQHTEGVLIIHETRMVIFGGARTPITRRQKQAGFDDSILQRVYSVLQDFGMTWRGLSNLMSDAQQGVYKLKGFIDMLAARDTSAMQRRLEFMDISRSIARSVVVDADLESFERQSFNFSGTDKIVQLFMLRLSAAARMPATILMSQSPAGMDATGESDLTWWYDTVESAQENDVKPHLIRVLELMLMAKDGPTGGLVPPAWTVEFPALVRPTPVEEVQMHATQAEADQKYVDMGAITPEEVATSRFTADGWKADTTIDLAARQAMAELDAELNLKDLNPPPPPAPTIVPGAPPAPGDPPVPPEPDPDPDPDA